MSERFAKVSAELIRADLTRNELKVALALLLHADQDGVCWPSAEAVAEHAGISRSSVFAALKGLKAKGWVTSSGRKRRLCAPSQSPGLQDETVLEPRTVPESGNPGLDRPGTSDSGSPETQDETVLEPRTRTETNEQTKNRPSRPKLEEVDQVFSEFMAGTNDDSEVRTPPGWVRSQWAREMASLLESGVSVDEMRRAARAQGVANRERPEKFRAKKPRSVLEGGLALLADGSAAPPCDLHGNPIQTPGNWNDHDARNLARGCVWMGEERPERPWGAPPPNWKGAAA